MHLGSLSKRRYSAGLEQCSLPVCWRHPDHRGVTLARAPQHRDHASHLRPHRP